MMSNNGLTKLLEEMGELSQVAAKKIAYLHTDQHPDGQGSLKARMEDEIADVAAILWFVTEQFDLDINRMGLRAALKLRTFRQWHADPDNYKE